MTYTCRKTPSYLLYKLWGIQSKYIWTFAFSDRKRVTVVLTVLFFRNTQTGQKKSSLLFSPLLFLLPWGVCSASWHISQRSCVRPSPAWIGEHTAVSCKKQNDGITRIYHNNFLNTLSASVQVAFSFPVCFLNTKLQVNMPISGPPTLFFAADLWE